MQDAPQSPATKDCSRCGRKKLDASQFVGVDGQTKATCAKCRRWRKTRAARRAGHGHETSRGHESAPCACARCLVEQSSDEFDGGDTICRSCRAWPDEEAPVAACGEQTTTAQPDHRAAGDADAAREAEEAERRRRRIASDHEALKPEDYDTSVANDGRIDPKAARERRQEFSKSMGEFAGSLHESEGDPDAVDSRLGTYIGLLSEQERRFGNRRLARSVSLAAAHEALHLRQVREFAAEHLRDKVMPTGYALRQSSTTAKRTVVLDLSDLHLGAELSALDNPEPFGAWQEARRLEYCARQLWDWKPEHRAQSEALIILNGDLVDGNLGHDLRDGAPLVEQKLIFWRLMRNLLATTAQVYPHVRVVGQCGNHGRDKWRHPGRATSSKWDGHEWEMLYALSQMCSGLANVTFDIPFRAVSIVDLQGAKALVTHGDTEVKLGAPETKTRENMAEVESLSLSRLHGSDFSLAVFGHFHSALYQPGQSVDIVWNGMLIPPNGHARASGYTKKPCGQWMWEAVDGFPVGDLRYLRLGSAQDNDERLGAIIKPFRIGAGSPGVAA